LKGERVLLRADLNVPIDSKGNVASDHRILQMIPTMKRILQEGASLVIMSHLGDPKGGREVAFSLLPVAKKLTDLLGVPVTQAPDCIGEDVEALAKNLKPGEVLLLENLRFHPEEKRPTAGCAFAKHLAKLGSFYVYDAFATAHRNHTSTTLASHFPKGKKAIGFLVEKELEILHQFFDAPNRPFFAIIGGLKIGAKIGMLLALLERVDGLYIGGAMAFTFLKALGHNVGDSVVDKAHLETAKNILKKGEELGVPLYLPSDIVAEDKEGKEISNFLITSGIPKGFSGFDVGDQTVEQWMSSLRSAKSIFWNGPLGRFEHPPFDRSTNQLAQRLGKLEGVAILIGGGDSAAAVERISLEEAFTHISTGGGATLQWIEKRELPAIQLFIEE